MKNLQKIALCACLVFAARTASAQMGMRAPAPSGVFNPIIGQGAQYEIQRQGGTKSTVEFSVVGKESVNGKDAYWIEMSTSAGMTTKTLTLLDGSNTVRSKTIMQMPGRPPMEMSSQMGRMGAQNSQTADLRSQAEDVGDESVTTPAGTFSCEHYRMKDGSGDTWVSTKVSPMGVVKHQGNDSTMVLTKVISYAKDKIVGTPQPFDPQMMMQQRPPQE